MKAFSKIIFGLVCTSGLIIFGGVSFGAEQDSDWWTFCDQNMDVDNNHMEKSWTYNEMVFWFEKKYGDLYARQQHSNRCGGDRAKCKTDPVCQDPVRFNNKVPKRDQVHKGKTFKLKSGEEKTEVQCYQDFINYATDQSNYEKDIVRDKFKPGSSKGYFKDSGVSDIAGLITKIQRLGSKTANFNHKDIRFLQSAVNILGCDKIMMDGKLGNYTIKSFCVCGTEPPAPPLACTQVTETAIGSFTLPSDLPTNTVETNILKELFAPSPLITEATKCVEGKDMTDKIFNPFLPPTSSDIAFGCASTATSGQYVPLCCPANTTLSKQKGGTDGTTEVISCCFDPSKDGNREKLSDESQALLGISKSCGPNTSITTVTLKGDDGDVVPICPCPSGSSREISKGSGGTLSFDCPCVKNANDCGTFYDKDGKELPETEVLVCGAVDNVLATQCRTEEALAQIQPICPCTANGGEEKRERANTGEPFACPCIDTKESLNKAIADNTEYKQEGKTFGPKGDVTSIDGVAICGCEGKKEFVYMDKQIQCNPCKEGTIPDDKGECVCDPQQQCCGIKLNTNVPRIGRCIQFGNTNDKDQTYTDTYGDGNTTITVNILNAFPLLMRALAKQALTIFLLFCFGGLIAAGVMMTSGSPGPAKTRISRIIIGVALVGASGVILRMINPNFFQ